MKQETKEKLLSMSLNENNSSTFVAQIVGCAIFGGVASRNFLLFALLLVPPLLVFFFSGKALFFHYLALGLCGVYTLCWGVVGFLVGNLFSVGAGIALAVVFFIPALLYNWLAFCYFLYE